MWASDLQLLEGGLINPIFTSTRMEEYAFLDLFVGEGETTIISSSVASSYVYLANCTPNDCSSIFNWCTCQQFLPTVIRCNTCPNILNDTFAICITRILITIGILLFNSNNTHEHNKAQWWCTRNSSNVSHSMWICCEKLSLKYYGLEKKITQVHYVLFNKSFVSNVKST